MSATKTIPKNRAAIFKRLDDGEPCVHVLLGHEASTNADQKLGAVTKAAGHVALYVQCGVTYELLRELECLLGYTFGWLMALGEEMPFDKISAERDRQDKLFVEGKLLFNCASRVADPKRKLRVLVEEVGEVAQAIDFLEHGHRQTRLKHLREEIIQVAAVAVAWLEALAAPVTKEAK